MHWPNLRQNASSMLDGDRYKKAEGEWMLYRWFDKEHLTENWNSGYDTAIGGEKFKYLQFLVRGIIMPIGGVFGLIADEYNMSGLVPQNGMIIFIHFDLPHGNDKLKKIRQKLKPKIGDYLFEIAGANSPNKPKLIKPLQRYIVLSVIPSKGDYGRTEAWMLHVDLSANKA